MIHTANSLHLVHRSSEAKAFAMARHPRLSFLVVLMLLSLQLAVSADPEFSPAPAPEFFGHSHAPLPPPPEAGGPVSPSPSSEFSSPPAPPPSVPAPGSSPTPSPTDSAPKSSPAPAPTNGTVVSQQKSDLNEDAEHSDDSSGGLKSRQKAGIVVGVIAAACLVGLGGLVYKKRQQNIRRSQYGYAARREIL